MVDLFQELEKYKVTIDAQREEIKELHLKIDNYS